MFRMVTKLMRTLEERMFKNREIIQRVPNLTPCWEWTKTLVFGYGQIAINKKKYRVHRVSFSIWKNFDLNSKLFICHKCDNKKCFNPEHLFIGDAKINAIDLSQKGLIIRGEKHWKSKLTEIQVLEIRKLSEEGWKRGDLKDKFCVSYETICDIINDRYWKSKIKINPFT